LQCEAHPGGQDAGYDDLPLGADVEESRAEGQRDAEAGRDERRGDGERLHERCELGGNAVAPGLKTEPWNSAT
jgi:hypothetical protein